MATFPRPRGRAGDRGQVVAHESEFPGAATVEVSEAFIQVVVALASDSVRAELDRYGVTELIGEDAYFDSLSEMHDAFRAAAPARPVST